MNFTTLPNSSHVQLLGSWFDQDIGVALEP